VREICLDLAQSLTLFFGLRMMWNVVSPRYFRAMGTKFVSGREFTDHDDAHAKPVAIVNQRRSLVRSGRGRTRCEKGSGFTLRANCAR
jgi:hypothetical protein